MITKKCKNCGEPVELRLKCSTRVVIEDGEIVFGKRIGDYFYEGECWECGCLNRDFEAVKYIQPSNEEDFERVYDKNPFKESKVKQKELDKIEEDRKINLDKKYTKQVEEGKLKPWEEKVIRREVLGK